MRGNKLYPDQSVDFSNEAATPLLLAKSQLYIHKICDIWKLVSDTPLKPKDYAKSS